jgi:hypothetical protein
LLHRSLTAARHTTAADSSIKKSDKVPGSPKVPPVEPSEAPLDHLLKSLEESFTKLKQGNELIANFLVVGENSIDLLRLQLGRQATSPQVERPVYIG